MSACYDKLLIGGELVSPQFRREDLQRLKGRGLVPGWLPVGAPVRFVRLVRLCLFREVWPATWPGIDADRHRQPLMTCGTDTAFRPSMPNSRP
jgi:hypothetical protein